MENTEVRIESNSKEKKNFKKNKFKMPGAITIIVGVVFFVMFLSWIPHSNGEDLEITITNFDGESITYSSGSLGSWQNYIIWTSINGQKIAPFKDIETWGSYVNENVLLENGLDPNQWNGWNGLINNNGYGYVTEADVPWTMSSFSDGSQSMVGIFDVFKALFGGYFMAWDVAFYLVGIYALVIVLMESETLKSGVSSLVKGLNGRELLLIPTLFILFSLGGTLFGMQEETLGLLPVIVPVLILAGFDAATGMMVATIGTTTGIAASVLDPFSVGVMAEGLDTTIGTALIERMLMFILYTALGATFVTLYASRVRKNPNKSLEKEREIENKEWAKKTIGNVSELKTMSRPQKFALLVFALSFVWMIFVIMPWTVWFPDLGNNSGWLTFSNFFMGGVLIGDWFFVELGIVFVAATILTSTFFKYSGSKILSIFKTSFIDMFGVITIIAFSRAISAIMSGTGLTYGMIYGMGADGLTGDHVVSFSMVWLLIFTLMALFIPSTSGLAGVTAPIVGGVISTASESGKEIMRVGILMVYPLAQGTVNMFSPTGTAVIQADQSKVSYGKVFPYLIGFASVLLVIGGISIFGLLAIENSLGIYS